MTVQYPSPGSGITVGEFSSLITLIKILTLHGCVQGRNNCCVAQGDRNKTEAVLQRRGRNPSWANQLAQLRWPVSLSNLSDDDGSSAAGGSLASESDAIGYNYTREYREG